MSKNEHNFHFGPAASLSEVNNNFPLLFTCSILDTFWPRKFILWCQIFLSFHTVNRVSQQEYRSRLPFPFPLDHVLSEVSTVTCLSWVVLHTMGHGFIELCKPFFLDTALIHEEVYYCSPQEYWSVPFLSPGDLPNPVIETLFSGWQADSETPGKPCSTEIFVYYLLDKSKIMYLFLYG